MEQGDKAAMTLLECPQCELRFKEQVRTVFQLFETFTFIHSIYRTFHMIVNSSFKEHGLATCSERFVKCIH